jgi:hypothetical protein
MLPYPTLTSPRRSIDDVPAVYVSTRDVVVARYARRGVASGLLHDPSLLMVTSQRMLDVARPYLRIHVVVAARAAFAQGISKALIADPVLRWFAHFAVASQGCLPISDMPRSGTGAEGVAYEFLASLVRPFVSGQWLYYCNTRLADELISCGPSTTMATLPGLRAAATRRTKRVTAA